MDECNNLQTSLGDVNLSRAEKHAKYKRKKEIFLVFMDIMTNQKVSSDKKKSEWENTSGSRQVFHTLSLLDGTIFPFNIESTLTRLIIIFITLMEMETSYIKSD